MQYDKILRNTRINFAFIYVTERCNLSCDYCFYKSKSKENINQEYVEILVNALKKTREPGKIVFIISGGEPLLEWKTTEKTIEIIRNEFPKNRIDIQTNGTLLEKETLSHMKKEKIKIEIGIDGDFITTSRHRKNIDKSYKRIINGIKLAKKMGIPISSNMTVHPKEAGSLLNNYFYLEDLGFKTIDITPAALQEWMNKGIGEFIKQYMGILKYAKALSLSDDFPKNEFFIDIGIMPSGEILPGDVFICLPPEVREDVSLARIKNNKFMLNAKIFKSYIKKYMLLKKGPAYKDHVISNFEMIKRLMKRHLGSNFYLDGYIRMLETIKRINQEFVSGVLDENEYI